jgi:hypothetical protein
VNGSERVRLAERGLEKRTASIARMTNSQRVSANLMDWSSRRSRRVAVPGLRIRLSSSRR